MTLPNVNLLGVPLSPTFSPIMVPLDDKPPLQQLPPLQPPPLQLDDSKGSTVYRTSLSKLGDKSQTKGTTDNHMIRHSKKNQVSSSSILRSASPIRVSMSNQVPKMLRPEYMNSKPLWRDQRIKMANNNLGEGVPTVLNAASALRLSVSSSGLAKVMEHPQNKGRHGNEAGTLPEHIGSSTYAPKVRDNLTPRHARELSTVSCLSGKTVFDLESPPLFNLHSPQSFTDSSYRFPSISSSTSSISNPSLDENVFEFKATPGNRDSIICGPLEDRYWIDSEVELHNKQIQLAAEIEADAENINESKISSMKLELQIKKLELQIEELKLQNEILKHTMEHSAIQDRLLMDALHEARKSKNNHSIDVEKKLKWLQAKVDDYKRTIDLLTKSNANGVHHKVAQLDDEQLKYIANEENCIQSKFKPCSNAVPTKGNHTDTEYDISTDTDAPRGRSSKKRLRGLHLNLSINMD